MSSYLKVLLENPETVFDNKELSDLNKIPGQLFCINMSKQLHWKHWYCDITPTWSAFFFLFFFYLNKETSYNEKVSPLHKQTKQEQQQQNVLITVIMMRMKNISSS